MNSVMEQKWPIVEGTHGMRTQLLDKLSDADLAYNPGGENVTLGSLWREMGEVEYAYLESFKTFKQDFDYRNTDASLDTSLTRLKAWFEAMDDEMKMVLSALSDDDLKKPVMRPSGNQADINFQLDTYLQAILIFFGKASIYYRALEKPVPENFREWFG